MNDFYDINNNKEEARLENPFQLRNLGDEVTMISVKAPGKNGWSSLGRSTTSKDYDRLFVNLLMKIDPPYRVDGFLDHHYTFYQKKFSGANGIFLKHIKYVILPEVEEKAEKQKKKKVYIELINEWLRAKESLLESHEARNPNLKTNQQDFNGDNDEVFISYSWDSNAYQKEVFDFMNFLRSKGFGATMDIVKNQKQSSINFGEMMLIAMNYPKVIVVLSNEYRIKADEFKGGVGNEYSILINDIRDRPKKYILISLHERDKNIIPLGLKGREIIDISEPGGIEKVFEKLMDHEKFIVTDVSPTKPVLPTISSTEFPSIREFPIIIGNPTFTIRSGKSSSGKYSDIDYYVGLSFKNKSTETLRGFSYSLKVPQQLAYKAGIGHKDGAFIVFSETNSGLFFPGQEIGSDQYRIRINRRNIALAYETPILIAVFSESGHKEMKFSLSDKLFINQNNLKNKVPLTIDMFQ